MNDRARRDFPEFVAARGAALQRAAYLMVGDPTVAQDLVQEALVKTYVAWPRLRDPGDLDKAEAYVRRVITTTAISWARRKGWNAERATEHLPERLPQRGGSLAPGASDPPRCPAPGRNCSTDP